MDDFGLSVRQRRVALGITLQHEAAAVERAMSHLSAIERGFREASSLDRYRIDAYLRGYEQLLSCCTRAMHRRSAERGTAES